MMIPPIPHRPAALAALLASCLVAACSPPAENSASNGAVDNSLAAVENSAEQIIVPPPAATAPPTEAGNTIGGDGSQIVLSPLAAKDIADLKLEGELACSFGTSGAQPLLLARGNVGSKDFAQGAIKVGDYVERVTAPGGYDGIIRGAVFGGKGTQIKIALTGAAATGGGESPALPATLRYDRADGAVRTFAGTWTCGP